MGLLELFDGIQQVSFYVIHASTFVCFSYSFKSTHTIIIMPHSAQCQLKVVCNDLKDDDFF